jgi:hypothetical protein
MGTVYRRRAAPATFLSGEENIRAKIKIQFCP